MFTVSVGLLLLFGIIGALVGPRQRVQDQAGGAPSYEAAGDEDDGQQQESDEDFLARERAAHYEDPYMPSFQQEDVHDDDDVADQ